MFWDQAWLAFAVFFETAQWFVFPIAILAGLALLPRRRVFLQSLVLTTFAAFALKLFFQQDRPCVVEQALVACPPDFGLPSIHSALSGVFIMASLGTRYAWVVVPIGMLVAYSRIFLNVHSTEQVIAGFALAAIAYLATWLHVQRAQEKKK
ncbi:phosphatase PAP2 family protein [Candidatus Micrarchaeota archaeon]|nr:phosphatase PAP2 family protein [Candidatus Micrarchaeota archaeon]